MQKILRCLMLLVCLSAFVVPTFAAAHKSVKRAKKVAHPKIAMSTREAIERTLPHMTLDEADALQPVVHAASAAAWSAAALAASLSATARAAVTACAALAASAR